MWRNIWGNLPQPFWRRKPFCPKEPQGSMSLCPKIFTMVENPEVTLLGKRSIMPILCFFLLALSHQSSLNLNIGYGSLSHKPIINNTICLINNSPLVVRSELKKVAAWLACNLFHVFSQSWDLSRAGADGRLLWRAVTLCGLGLMLIFWAQATPRAAMEAASEGHSVHDPVVRPLFVRFWKNRSHIDIASMI